MAICVLTLAILNTSATFLHWYEVVWWFDMPMHFLGGLTVFYFSAIIWKGALKWVTVGRFLFESIITALLIGVLWEGLEYYLFVNYGSPQFILMDSFSDVFFDLSGSILGALLIAPGFYKSKITQ